MPTSLRENLPDALKSVRTRPLFVIREQIPPMIVVGETPKRVPPHRRRPGRLL